jgi:hypothetical protein
MSLISRTDALQPLRRTVIPTTAEFQRAPGEADANDRAAPRREAVGNPVVEVRMRGDRERNAGDGHAVSVVPGAAFSVVAASRNLSRRSSNEGQVLGLYGRQKTNLQILWITLCVNDRSLRRQRRGLRACHPRARRPDFFPFE